MSTAPDEAARPDTSKYETFLRMTKRRVESPATDHDKAVIGAGQTALRDQIDDLKDLKKRVGKLIDSRVAILDGEERSLRALQKANTRVEYREAEVILDARQGGVILVRDLLTKAVLYGPEPLTAAQREVFNTTKSQPGFFDDPVGVNEELARKLNLAQYLADEPPTTIEERIARALDAGDLPEDIKEAILSMDEEGTPKRKKAKEPKPAKEPKAKGRQKKADSPAAAPPPAPLPPPADPAVEPGPAKAEKDEELPKAPPRTAAPDEDEPSVGDAAESSTIDAGEESVGAPAEDDDAAAIPDEPAPSAEEPEPAEVGAEDAGEQEWETPTDAEAPGEPVTEAPSLEELAVAAPPVAEAPPADEEAPRSEDAPALKAEPEPEPVAAEPAPPPAAAPVSAPAPAAKKRGRAKKDEPAPTTATPAPAAAPALCEANNWGLPGVKMVQESLAGLEAVAKRVVLFGKTAVPQIEADAKFYGFSAEFKAAVVPLLDHLVAQGKISSKAVGSDKVYWNPTTISDEKLAAVIAGR